MKKRENKLKSMIVEYGFACILFLVIMVLCITGIQTAEQKYREEALSSAKESILRGAINCYALEGVYPPDYEYLKENYGVRVDEEKYAVFYTVFASNMMPDVTVVEK